ncbi:MAG: hypothetical protein AB1847_23070, partial [bacterium]
LYGSLYGGLYGYGNLYGLSYSGLSTALAQIASYPAYARPYLWGYDALGSSLLSGYSGWQGTYWPGLYYY